jgi:hypothetical protein
MGAKKGTHDDLVIALGLAIKALEQAGDYIPPHVLNIGDESVEEDYGNNHSFWEV